MPGPPLEPLEPTRSRRPRRPVCSWPSALLPGLTLCGLVASAGAPATTGGVTVYEMTVTAVAHLVR